MHVIYERRLSHRKWRNFIRRERRRRKRQKLAKERDKATKEKILALMSDPIYRAEIEEQERLHEEALRMEEEEAQRQREEWCARDLALHSLWLKEQEKKNNILKEKEMKEEQLKREWKERQKKEEKERQEKQMQQVRHFTYAKESLLQEATSNLGVKEATHNPEPPVGHARIYKEQKIQPCPFFTKTGACRFGTQCSREHDYPSSSVTILLPNMYSHFGFVEETADDYDTDLSLEFSESDRNQHFRDFFFDVLPEFEKCGKVIQFKVCCNKSPHLRGNVYVQYNKIKDAEKAVGLFNGRWYAGKQISCIFVPIERWRPAICGLHWSQKCPKGDRCNFLHVYRNPGNAFFKADKDHYIKDYDGEDIEESFYSKRNGRRSREESDHRHRSSRSSTRKKRRENSRTRDRSDRSRSRSRARESSSSRKLKNGSSSRCRKHTSRSRSSSIRKRKSRRSRSKS